MAGTEVECAHCNPSFETRARISLTLRKVPSSLIKAWAFQLQKRQPPCLSPLEAFTASLKFGSLLLAWTLVGSTSRQVDEERRATVPNNNNNNSSSNNNHGRSKSRNQSRFFYLFAADCFFKGSHERSWLPDCELSKSFRCFERVQATPSPFCNWCWVRYLLINTNEQLELATRQ